MKLIPLYETHEINGQITYRKLFFNPKGLCNFLGIIQYNYKHVNIVVEIETNKKTTREAFVKIAQQFLNEVEEEFYSITNYLKLSSDTPYNTEDTIGKFESFVIIK